MGISLDTRASAVQSGRCVDCGKFVSRHGLHFHAPKSERRFRRRPKPHLMGEGGGIVTRCDDPIVARPLILREYARVELDTRWSELDAAAQAEVEDRFPLAKARVEQGRVNVTHPDISDGYTWWWYSLPAGSTGRGVTTAVVWDS
jgi:hypothetical protein